MPPARALLVLASLGLAACGEPPPGRMFEDPLPAAPIVLARQGGGTFDLSAEKGRVVVLYFGYTHCPDVCPATLGDWARARRALGRRASEVRFVFISVDPERDTPELAASYAKQFDSTFVGLSGSVEEIEALKRAWGIAAYREGDVTGEAYAVAHPAATFVVDRQGRVRLIIEPGVPGDQMARSLRRLL
jgi:protein SCO1/2